MGRSVTRLNRLPNSSCRACHGMGAIRMTVHFHSGDAEWEAPCWECYGSNVKMTFPHPVQTDN